MRFAIVAIVSDLAFMVSWRVFIVSTSFNTRSALQSGIFSLNMVPSPLINQSAETSGYVLIIAITV